MSIGSHQLLLFLLQVGALLSIALCLGKVATWFGMPTVVGELLTGVLLGPSVFGHIAGYGWFWPRDIGQTQLLDAVSQLGVLFFVGVSGAHLDMQFLRRHSRTVATVGSIALLVPLAIGITAGFMLPAAVMGPAAVRGPFALLVGVVMAVSAIPVIAKTFMDLKLIHRDIGQLTLATAATHDVIAWLLLSVVSVMTLRGFDERHLMVNLLYMAGFLFVAAVAIRPLAKAGMGLAVKGDGAGPAIVTAVVLIVGCAAASHALGLEAVMGAFVAGIMLGSRGSSVTTRLAPLRTVVLAVFAPLFLASAGLRMDLSVLRDPTIVLIAVIVLALAVFGKLASAYAGARLSRLSHWEGLALGAGLNARGAVEVVVATVGLRIGVLNTAMYTIVVLVAVLTSMMAPPMLRWTMARVEQRAHEQVRGAMLAAWSGEPTQPVRQHAAHPAQN